MDKFFWLAVDARFKKGSKSFSEKRLRSQTHTKNEIFWRKKDRSLRRNFRGRGASWEKSLRFLMESRNLSKIN